MAQGVNAGHLSRARLALLPYAADATTEGVPQALPRTKRGQSLTEAHVYGDLAGGVLRGDMQLLGMV
jgi:hypothetical protein